MVHEDCCVKGLIHSGTTGRRWCLWEVGPCGEFSSPSGHAPDGDCGTPGPSSLFTSWPWGEQFCCAVCSWSWCAARPKVKVNRTNWSWTGTYKTVNQNKPFLFVSDYLVCFVIVMKSWLTAHLRIPMGSILYSTFFLPVDNSLCLSKVGQNNYNLSEMLTFSDYFFWLKVAKNEQA